MVYPNNSLIQVTEIGETNTISNTGLQCITYRMSCCTAPGARDGEWYFPEEWTTLGSAITFYQNRGDDGMVNLKRVIVPCHLNWFILLCSARCSK